MKNKKTIENAELEQEDVEEAASMFAHEMRAQSGLEIADLE